MTILTSLLGTKALGLLYLLQDAAAATSPAATDTTNTFSMTEMFKHMGPVGLSVIIV